MVKSSDNYWILTSGGPFTFPASVTVTSIFGDVVTDTVPDGPVGTFVGGAQFPLSSAYPQIGGAGAARPQPQPGLARCCLVSLAAPPCAPGVRAQSAVLPDRRCGWQVGLHLRRALGQCPHSRHPRPQSARRRLQCSHRLRLQPALRPAQSPSALQPPPAVPSPPPAQAAPSASPPPQAQPPPAEASPAQPPPPAQSPPPASSAPVQPPPPSDPFPGLAAPAPAPGHLLGEPASSAPAASALPSARPGPLEPPQQSVPPSSPPASPSAAAVPSSPAPSLGSPPPEPESSPPTSPSSPVAAPAPPDPAADATPDASPPPASDTPPLGAGALCKRLPVPRAAWRPSACLCLHCIGCWVAPPCSAGRRHGRALPLC